MKKIYSILMILAAAAGFTNCSKADLVENKETGNGEAVVYATTDAATKTTLADDYKVLWSTGDQIKFVKSGTPATTYTFTLSSGSGTTSGTFTCNETPVDGTYTVYYPDTYPDTNWPAQTYVDATDISGAPMTATATVSGGIVSDISFKNEGGILRYTVKGTKTIKSINVKSASPALDVTLDCGEGVALAAEGTVFNIALPEGEYSNATLSFTAKNNIVATKIAGDFKVTKNKVSLATFDGLAYTLAGVFTVDNKGNDDPSDDVKVRFSGGNLYAKKESGVWNWHFYDEQYKYNSIATSSGSRTAADTDTEIDLFTWGYNAEKSIIPNINTPDNVNRTAGDLIQTEDWGSQIGDGNTWRTLTTEEWQYLFDTRTVNGGTGEGKSYQRATINADATSVYGMILYPDNYTSQTDATSYTSTEWTTMEENGCVFLPAAGSRYCSAVDYVGDYGYYWSSTAEDEYEAYYVCFYSLEVNPYYYNDREIGYSVRLVTESK